MPLGVEGKRDSILVLLQPCGGCLMRPFTNTHEQKRTRKNVYKMQLSIFVLILFSLLGLF